jgi:RNA polymerase sigma-70 factor (ECF subfamily)
MQDPVARTVPLDPAELARLFDQYGDSLYRYCVRLLACPDDAADAVQDAFANLARRRAALPSDPVGRRVYLFAAVRNACLDLRRRRRVHIGLDALQDDGIEIACTDASRAPESATLDRFARAQLAEALARVPERQRTAWVLREEAGLSYDEIGDRLALHPNAVAQLLHRARRSLLATPEVRALQASS